MDEGSELIAEQLRHTIDLLRAELNAIKAEQKHKSEFYEHRITSLEDSDKDHETRLRSLQDGVTSFKVWSGLANGGASIVSLFALFRSIFGG